MQKKKGQKYQNKKAFEIQFDPKAVEDHKKVKLQHLCKRCLDQIMWKIQFNKYKKQTEPSKCNICALKVVIKSYHQACDHCSVEKDICSKCLKPNNQIIQPSNIPILNKKVKDQMNSKQQDNMNNYLKDMRERSKRKVMRQYEKGNYEWDDQARIFTDKNGNPIDDIKFKGERQDEDQQDLDDLDQIQNDDDEQEIGSDKQQNKIQEQKINRKQSDDILDQDDQNQEDWEQNSHSDNDDEDESEK